MDRLRTGVALALLIGTVLVLGAHLLLGIALGASIVIALPIAAAPLLVVAGPWPSELSWEPLPEQHGSPASQQLSQLVRRLEEAEEDPRRFRTRLRPRLAAVALARLRQTRAVTSLADPAARAALGAELHRLLTDPRAELPSPRRLSELLDVLENL
jgi:hypothetical protein